MLYGPYKMLVNKCRKSNTRPTPPKYKAHP